MKEKKRIGMLKVPFCSGASRPQFTFQRKNNNMYRYTKYPIALLVEVKNSYSKRNVGTSLHTYARAHTALFNNNVLDFVTDS